MKIATMPKKNVSNPARTAADDSNDRVRTPTLAVETAITDAAKALLQEEGPEALSIRRIANRAGVAPMSVYNRFGSKQGVVDALFIEGFQKLDNALGTRPGDDVEVCLVEVGRRYREFALNNPTLYSLMFMRTVRDYEPSENAGTVASESFRRLLEIVTPWVDDGTIENGDPIEISQRIWASIHGSVSLELNGIGFVEDQADHVAKSAKTMAEGLIARRPKAPRQKTARTR